MILIAIRPWIWIFGLSFLILIAGSLSLSDGLSQTTRYGAEQEILAWLFNPETYDKRLRPYVGNKTNPDAPVVAFVNIYVRDIERISDITMDYNVQLTFRMRWKDSRLQYSHLNIDGPIIPSLTLKSDESIWKPDLFFSNEKEAHYHNSLARNMYVRIFPDGDVLFSERLSLTLACRMNLKTFPFDSQLCSIAIASYGASSDELTVKWKTSDPVQVTDDLSLRRFSLVQYQSEYCDTHTATGRYSCLRADFLFRRDFHSYFLQIYIPTILLVIVGWMSLWLDSKGLPGPRISLCMLTLLFLCLLVFLVNERVPTVAYTKALDIWTGACLAFLFLALGAGVMANYAYRWAEGEEDLRHHPHVKHVGFTKHTKGRIDIGAYFSALSVADWIDVGLRALYPVLFSIFAILYFTTFEAPPACHLTEGVNTKCRLQ